MTPNEVGLRAARAKCGQVRLYLVPADGPVRDDRAAVARALLDRWYPICPVLTDQALASLGDDLVAIEGLENDPRYLIGRLSQDWRKAERYEALWRDLGLIGELPRPRPRLKRVT
jgi:hypothetical protein